MELEGNIALTNRSICDLQDQNSDLSKKNIEANIMIKLLTDKNTASSNLASGFQEKINSLLSVNNSLQEANKYVLFKLTNKTIQNLNNVFIEFVLKNLIKVLKMHMRIWLFQIIQFLKYTRKT